MRRYKGVKHLESILQTIDAYLLGTGRLEDVIPQLHVWDIDNITDSYRLDLLAQSIGLWGWDKAWDLDEKIAKIKIGVQLKLQVGTPFAVKNVCAFVLDQDRFDQVNRPVEIEERAGQFCYDGSIIYDGTSQYNSEQHWTAFRLIIPYDGNPTQEEIDAVVEQVNNYKRLVTYLLSIEFVPLQQKYLHARPGSTGQNITIPHNDELNCVDGSGDSIWTIAFRIWWEGFGGSFPYFITKDVTPGGDVPFLIYSNYGSVYTVAPRMLVREGVSTYVLQGTSNFQPNKTNNCVLTYNGNTGNTAIHHAYANDSDGALTTNVDTGTTSVNGAINTDDILILKAEGVTSRQPYTYLKDLCIDNREWTSEEITEFLSETNFGAYSLEKVPNLIDEDGKPLLASNSPLAFWRGNEEAGTVLTEFQGKTGINGTITGMSWDTWVDAWGGDAVADDLVSYFPMNENSASPIYHDVIQGNNDYLLESTEPSEDWATASLLGTGLEVAASTIDLVGHFLRESKSLVAPFNYGFWFRVPNSSQPNKIYYRNLDDSGVGIYVVTNALSRMEFYMTDGTGNYWMIPTTGAFTSTTPHFITFGFGGSGSASMILFWNGVDQGTATETGVLATWNTGDTLLFRGETIEGTAYTAPNLDYFESFFEMNRAMTLNEHIKIYNKLFGLKVQEKE